MDKLSRWIVTITVIETWTITWADGAASTVVYSWRQSLPLSPACPTDPLDEHDLESITTDSSPYHANPQIEAGEPPGSPPDGMG